MIKKSPLKYLAVFSVMLLAFAIMGCGSYVSVTEYSVEAVSESFQTAEFSERDWEGYTDYWSEDASDVYFVTTVDGQITDANISDEQMNKTEWGYYTVSTQPPVSIPWTNEKHFDKYESHFDVKLYLVTEKETLGISKEKYQEILARLEAGKSISVNYRWNKVNTEDPKE